MDEELQVKIFGANDDGIKLVMKHYNKSESDVEDGIQIIMDWYEKQPHLPKNAIDKPTIARYYANTKYSIENTKQKLENYYTMKGMCPEYYTNCDPLDSKFILTGKYIEWCLIPDLTPENCRVLFLRFTDEDPSMIIQHEFYKYVIMLNEMRMRYECCIGEILVLDFKCFSIKHALNITPVIIKKLMYLGQECYSARMKEIHVVNFTPHAKTVFNILKSFLKKKIVNRIHMHNNLEELHKHIPPIYLPVEMGGLKYKGIELIDLVLFAMQTEFWKKRFKYAEEKIADESKRLPDSINTIENLFGIMGSFRKIEID